MSDFRKLPDGSLLHTPKNHLLTIDRVWVFVSVDEEGNEGMCAAPMAGMGVVPLIAADEDRLKSLTPIAKHLATISGRPIRLIRLSTREEVRVFSPDDKS